MRDEKESRETMDTGYSKWRKLDNAALAFPLVTGKDDTRVFCFRSAMIKTESILKYFMH